MDESLSILLTLLDTSDDTIRDVAVCAKHPGRLSEVWMFWGEPDVFVLYSMMFPELNLRGPNSIVRAVEISSVIINEENNNVQSS